MKTTSLDELIEVCQSALDSRLAEDAAEELLQLKTYLHENAGAIDLTQMEDDDDWY